MLNQKIKSRNQLSSLLYFLPVIFLAVSCTPQAPANDPEARVEIDGEVIKVEVADDQAERNQGLMHRADLDDDRGMIFVFEEYGYYSFWMKNTLIPLDIIWIAGDKIVYIKHSAPPGEGVVPPSYASDVPANLVLEVNGGVAEENGWEVGDKVNLTLP